MKTLLVWLATVLCGIACAGQAHAQYNLRTIPAVPQAGAPFVVAFDGNICESFFLTAPANPPTVITQGTTVRVAVDHLALANCIAQPATHLVSIPGLAQGSYQLELYTRPYQSPGGDLLGQTILFQVGGAATATGTFSIPVDNTLGLTLLAAAIAALSLVVLRRYD